jgi:hypothetical protein
LIPLRYFTVAHTYLLDLYQALNQRRLQCAPVPGESDEEQAVRLGRLAACEEVLAFLRDNYHWRLPRRLQGEALKLLAEKNGKPTTGEDL